MMKNWLIIILISFGFAACQSSNTSLSSEVKSSEEGVKIGLEVDEAIAVNLTELESQIQSKTKLDNITLTGKVKDVCQAKGCWMSLLKEDGETVRVTFKDYALFMPKDIVGKDVVIHGMAEMKTTSVEELRHYAEDAGKSESEIKQITEAQNDLAFEADGVLIKN